MIQILRMLVVLINEHPISRELVSIVSLFTGLRKDSGQSYLLEAHLQKLLKLPVMVNTHLRKKVFLGSKFSFTDL